MKRHLVGHVVIMLETTDEVDVDEAGASHFVRSFRATPSIHFFEAANPGVEGLSKDMVKQLEAGAAATLLRAANEKFSATMKNFETGAVSVPLKPTGPLS